ncbi:COG4315 family predicted lipoprotein [Pseudomonas sp. RA_35y_Pfl2_P32]|uniref:COG4315 family predicted lipoprotein n=1 Tax=Pseudomonas sp. RA_35y_Pfl2_P32 TaxID=3088705 RepID=UPI0030D72BDD
MTDYAHSFKALVLAVALALPGMAMAAEPAMMKGGMMVDHQSMTLYTFDKDSGGKSMCNDDCAKNWPPLMAPMDAKANGKWTTIKRDDGKMQWAYDGKPLYTFVKDENPGEMKGDMMKDVWHVVRESQK